MAYIGKTPARGQNREIDDISSSFNGSNTAFTLQSGGLNVSPGSVNQLFVNLGGVMQNPGTDFTVSNYTITFTTPPASGLSFWAVSQGDAVDINTPADDSVTGAKLSVSLVAGDTLYASGADTLARLPKGTDGEVLKLASGVPSWAADAGGAALTGSTNNTVTTVTGANAIQGEANLTFDGTHLGVGTATPAVVSGGPGLVVHGTTAPRIRLTNDTTGQAGTDGSELSIDGTTKDFWIENREDAEVRFATNGAERFILENDGDVTIKDGDLVIGTSGHGIDFSAGAGGDATSNILDEYEEGTFTSSLLYNNSSACGFSTSPAGGTDLFYTKIGRLVHVVGYIKGWTMTTGDGSNATISLPFAVTGGRNQAPGSLAHYTCFNHSVIRCLAEPSSTRLDFFQDNSTSRTTWSSGSSNYLALSVTYFTDT